ncbi:MAG: hypothetical protein R3357_01415, partial [Burkholderiales bacterium]|nr:hypothetical protein [Burkholderiales bacterium]
DLAQVLSVSFLPILPMRRTRRSVVLWFALFAWIAGWYAHAGMALAQAAGQAQVCSSGEAGGSDAPTHGNAIECIACAQALSGAADGAHGAVSILGVAASEGALSALAYSVDCAPRIAAHTPRAPPAA